MIGELFIQAREAGYRYHQRQAELEVAKIRKERQAAEWNKYLATP